MVATSQLPIEITRKSPMKREKLSAPKVAVIGCGPAGLFCAYELARLGAQVTVFEKGPILRRRHCPDHNCTSCPLGETCAILCGEGGAGGYSDGKVTLSTGRGVQLGNELDFQRYVQEINDVDRICRYFGGDGQYFQPVSRPAFLDGTKFKFESYPLRFYTTDGIRALMHDMRIHLETKYRVQFLFQTDIVEIFNLKTGDDDHDTPVAIVVGDEGVKGRTSDFYDRAVIASGSHNRELMRQVAQENAITLDYSGPAGIGLRLEAPTEVLEPLMAAFYDFKLYLHHDFMGVPVQYRSFCVNRNGSIVNEHRQGITSINGRSETVSTGRSNLAIMTKIPNGKDLVRNTAALINQAGGGLPVYQRSTEFCGLGRPTKQPHPKARENANPGCLTSIMDPNLLRGFQEYILELEKVVPGAATDPDSLVYAPEIKYHMPRWPLEDGFRVRGAETIYVIGNAAGYTDSISTAAVMGLVAARDIVKAD